MICPKCGRLHNEEDSYCELCRTQLIRETITCPRCGEKTDKYSRVCTSCLFNISKTVEYIDCPKCGEKTGGNLDICSVCLSRIAGRSGTPLANKKYNKTKNENSSIASAQPIKCPKCGKVNDVENTYCDSCRAELRGEVAPRIQTRPSSIYCYKCGAQNEGANRFCSACGVALIRFSQAQPATEHVSPRIQPRRATGHVPPPVPPRPKPVLPPYITEYVLGLIGSMTGTIIFLILLITGIYKALSSYTFAYTNSIYIFICALLVLASFILGYIGICMLKRGNGIGGVHLVIGGA
ncbi:MAG: hypothetical protein HN948_03530, partial [Clostridia bacterium]|nr:hypothetical protein [Clostridia bacterium]